jgi:restriction system protein
VTATHHTARRPQPARRRRTRRLPRLGWWWLTLPVLIVAAAKTWPIATSITAGLAAAAIITAAIRPRTLTPLIDRAAQLQLRRSPLPAPGRRTLDTFQRMQPYEFERAIAALAREDRDRVAHAENVGGANDRGADVIVTLRDGRRIMIQCKRYNGHNVGSEDVQKTNGTYRDIHHCHQAAIVTTAGYTRDAYDTNRLFRQPLRLMTGAELLAWANGAGPAPW